MDSTGRINLSAVPLLPAIAGVIAGILLLDISTSIYIFGALVVAVAILGFLHQRFFAVCVASAAIGWLAAFIDRPTVFDTLPARDTVYAGTISRVAYDGDNARLFIDTDSRMVGDSAVSVGSFRVNAYLKNPKVGLLPGDRVHYRGVFSFPRIRTDLPTDNDLSDYYRNNGVSLTCFVTDSTLTVVGRSSSLLYPFRRMQARLSEMLEETSLSEGSEAFMSAIILGDTSDIDYDLRQKFSKAGVAHVLALSGAHLVIIAMIINFLLSPMALLGYRRSRWWIAVAILWAYVLMTGMSPSVVRAAIMVTAVFLGATVDRPRSAINSLLFAALVILLFTPRALWLPGFQFSFLATLSIVLFSGRLNPVGHKRPIARFFSNWLLVTLAATLATMPLMAWHFHLIPLFFLPANLLAVILLPVVIILGILLLLLLALGISSGWLEWGIDRIYSVFARVVDWIAGLPGGVIYEIYFSPWLLIPIFLAIGALVLMIYRRRHVYFYAAIALCLFTLGCFAVCRGSYPEHEAFVYAKPQYTNVWLHHGDTVIVLTSARQFDVPADSAEWRDRHRDFFGSRHISEFEIIASPRNCIVEIGDATYKFASDEAAAPIRTTYCIVDINTRGDVETIVGKCNADTLLLSPYLNNRRLDKFRRLAPAFKLIEK